MKRFFKRCFLLVPFLGLVLAGCATEQSLQPRFQALDEKISVIQSQVRENREAIDQVGERVVLQEQKIQALSRTAEEALERAKEAGKLAEGRFLLEMALSDEQTGFGFDQSHLSGEAKARLSHFAWNIKGEGKGAYIEVQGHTDSLGPENYNMHLGLRRAREVMRYLHVQHGFPLHRMHAISYGETEPVADNATKEGRARNRRVTLVVLK